MTIFYPPNNTFASIEIEETGFFVYSRFLAGSLAIFLMSQLSLRGGVDKSYVIGLTGNPPRGNLISYRLGRDCEMSLRGGVDRSYVIGLTGNPPVAIS